MYVYIYIFIYNYISSSYHVIYIYIYISILPYFVTWFGGTFFRGGFRLWHFRVFERTPSSGSKEFYIEVQGLGWRFSSHKRDVDATSHDFALLWRIQKRTCTLYDVHAYSMVQPTWYLSSVQL